MKKAITILVLLLTVQFFAQKKTCDTPEEILEDLNSITKCSITPTKKGKKGNKPNVLKVRVSTNKKHFLKKRAQKQTKLKASGVSQLKTASTKKILALSNKISKDEIAKAKKFIEVDEIPAFNKCAKYKGEEREECFNTEMVNHINNHFYYPSEAVKNDIQGTIWVRFIIDTDGNVSNVKTVGNKGTEQLKDVAIYMVSQLPKFTPGTKGGSPVPVKYGFPIDFSLDTE